MSEKLWRYAAPALGITLAVSAAGLAVALAEAYEKSHHPAPTISKLGEAILRLSGTDHSRVYVSQPYADRQHSSTIQHINVTAGKTSYDFTVTRNDPSAVVQPGVIDAVGVDILEASPNAQAGATTLISGYLKQEVPGDDKNVIVSGWNEPPTPVVKNFDYVSGDANLLETVHTDGAYNGGHIIGRTVSQNVAHNNTAITGYLNELQTYVDDASRGIDFQR